MSVVTAMAADTSELLADCPECPAGCIQGTDYLCAVNLVVQDETVPVHWNSLCSAVSHPTSAGGMEMKFERRFYPMLKYPGAHSKPGCAKKKIHWELE